MCNFACRSNFFTVHISTADIEMTFMICNISGARRNGNSHFLHPYNLRVGFQQVFAFHSYFFFFIFFLFCISFSSHGNLFFGTWNMNGINEMTSTALISMKGKKNVSLIPFFSPFILNWRLDDGAAKCIFI